MEENKFKSGQSEQEKLLEEFNINPEQDILGSENQETSAEPEKEEVEMKLRNRKERRLAEKLQKEREANIALNARLQGISEAKRVSETTEEAEYLKLAEQIFGNATPETEQATEIFKKILKGVHLSAKDEALAEALQKIDEERTSESAAVQKEEENLDEMFEKLEDKYGVDFENDSLRTGFLTLLEKISPKDDEGNIKEYADPEMVYEAYESLKTRSNATAKDLSSRSMIRSGSSHSEKKAEQSAVEKQLREWGIL